MMKIKDVKTKNCMTKSKLTDYVINPYIGCQHGCKYCYAVFMKRFQNISDEWGSFCFAKINCPELLEKELKKNKPGNIFMSSVTDLYTPIEGKYKLTRKILETIVNSEYRNKFSIEILTKSALVRRDFDLIKQLNAELGMSINTLDEKKARIIEPLASPPMERIKTLKEAQSTGIKVFGFISPVIPGITDLEQIFKELKFCPYVWVELLNTKSSVLSRLMPVLQENFPESAKEIQQIMKRPKEYYKEMEKEIRTLEKKYGLKVREIVVH